MLTGTVKMQFQIDNPLTRNSPICPLCSQRKDKGLVSCWGCYRRSGLKYGNPSAAARIAANEARLERMALSSK
jgi:hypothetical protein